MLIKYFLFGVLWIYFSDAAINLVVSDLETLKFLQTIKGWLFICISSLILFFFSKQQFEKIQNETDQLAKTKDLLETIIENAPISVFWKDLNGAYIGANSKFLELINLQNRNIIYILKMEKSTSLIFFFHYNYLPNSSILSKLLQNFPFIV